ncbi:MAG: sulfite exporter TauE/SafE family protein [Dermatophilaceae bacterium]
MSLLDAVLVMLAGAGAGMINAIVGSGTLITFPTLLVLGYPPLTANVSNNIGLVAGSATAAYGYRTELVGQPLLARLLPMSVLGSIVGAALLLVLPAAAFRSIVPMLIALSLVLVLVGPRLQAAMARRRERQGAGDRMPGAHAVALGAGVFVGGVYGGYFGAAQGVLLMGLLSALSTEPLQRLNGLKNVLVTVVNLVAAVAFVMFAREYVSWPVVVLIAVGSMLGGLLGARIGLGLSPMALRAIIVVVGVVAIVKMLAFP